MPELEPAQNSADTPDPIGKLHKMSTTAGVGSQDYVAINTSAIVSVILGLCTALAFMGIPFLVVGAAGIAFGIIALVQIRHSNGTQGGTGLAILGIVLSLGIAGSVAAASIVEWSHEREDREAIDKLLEDLGQYVAAGQYDKAYQFFTPEFQGVIKPQIFRDQLQGWQQYFWKIEGMSSNKAFVFAPTTEGIYTAQTQALVRFVKPTTMSTQPADPRDPRRVPMVLQKLDGQWRISYMDMFKRP